MNRLIRYQVLKFTCYKKFVSLVGAYFFLSFAIVFLLKNLTTQMTNSLGLAIDIFTGEVILDTMCWVVKYCNVLLAVLIIGILCSDFRYGMIKQAVIGGFSRLQLLFGYIFVCFLCTCISLVLLISLCYFFSSSQNPFFLSFKDLQVILSFAVYSFIAFEFAVMVAFIIKSSFASLILYFLWYLVIESILGYTLDFYFSSQISPFLPFHFLSNLLPIPLWANILPEKRLTLKYVSMGSVFYGLLFPFVSYAFFSSSNLLKSSHK